jgi:hypothetical protein
VHCRKSWRNISSPLDISELFHEDIITNIWKNILRSISLHFSRSISNFSELSHSVIYDERFRDLSGRLSADRVLLLLFSKLR